MLPGSEKDFASRSVTVSQKIAHANKRELVDLVKNERIAKKVDFGEMDINVAREFVDTIWRAKSKYSFLDFPFIGSNTIVKRQSATKYTN